jgi:hypothetical protein
MRIVGLAFASDVRFKNNIEYEDTIDGINFYSWEWNEFALEYVDSELLARPYGVIAQELVLQYPELVHLDENGYMYVDYDGLQKILGA